jgi:hypothetical protein
MHRRAAVPLARTVLAIALLAACDRSQRQREGAAPPPPLPSAPAARKGDTCTLPPIPLKHPTAPRRLVAVGDLHGDLAATRAALRAAGVLNVSDSWIGDDTVVVQTGDVLDRGDDEEEIYELLEKLEAEARAAGGAIVLLNGNHELMNTARDFRYVTRGALSDFGGDRERAFDPGGPWAKRLARYNVVAIVGDSVFSHAGVLPDWVPRVDDANLATRCWFDGQAGRHDQPPSVLTSDDSPVWTRAYGVGAVDCAALGKVLAALGAKRMVVGHTVQQRGITEACQGALWRIDVGLAAYYGGPIEVLEITDSGEPRVLRGTR